jgi:hypothetical protein|tara:strand:+ start:109 stop:372 length:264 start_codon:yes stop_codon:yes gene_type:complete
MIKELKYLLFTIIIIIFIFFTGKFYFSDKNIKNSYTSKNNIDHKIRLYSQYIPTINNDTQNIIEYVKNTQSKSKKKFFFWELIDKDD